VIFKWIFLAASFFAPFFAMALEMQPWFGEVYEFYLLSSYSYSRFSKVQDGVPQLKSPFNVNLLYFDLDFPLSPEWSVDADVQFADTTQQSFNFRTAALQGRYLWLDDIIGDKVSLSTGGNVRFTPTYALHDISCPSRTNVDFELNFSIGKELEVKECILFRVWGFGAVGQGIFGAPWVRATVALETNIDDKHKFALYGMGDNGYGRHSRVLTNDFHGYGKIRTKSIDVGLRYGYQVGVWGTVRIEYARRFLSKAAPAHVNSWIISYLLPFSF
jgi:hypothetical protein